MFPLWAKYFQDVLKLRFWDLCNFIAPELLPIHDSSAQNVIKIWGPLPLNWEYVFRSLGKFQTAQNRPTEADPEPYVPVREFLAFVGECVVLLFREIRSLK